MKIKRLIIKFWKRHQDLTINFSPGLNHIIGLNNKGKTSIMKAIAWALYPARANLLLMPVDPKRDIYNQGDLAEVTIDFTLPVTGPNGLQSSQDHTIHRGLGKNNKGSFYSIDGEEMSLEKASEYFTSTLGLPCAEQLSGLLWQRQGFLDRLIRLGPENLMNHMHRLLGYQVMDPIVDELKKKADALSAQALDIRSRGTITTDAEKDRDEFTKKLEALNLEISELPSISSLNETKGHIQLWIKHREKLTLQTEIDTALEALPITIKTWFQAVSNSVNASSTERSLETLRTIGRLKTTLSRYDSELSTIPDATNLRQQINDIDLWLALKTFELTQKQIADQIAALPEESQSWARAFSAGIINNVSSVRSLDTLRSIVRLKTSIAGYTQTIASIGTISPTEVTDIRRWIVSKKFSDKCKETSNALVLMKVPALLNWARSFRTLLTDTKTLTREERSSEASRRNIFRAQFLIDQNRQKISENASNTKHNLIIETLQKTLNSLLGNNPPDSLIRSSLLQALDYESSCNKLANDLELTSHPDVHDLSKALAAYKTHSLQAPHVTCSKSKTIWNSKHEQALEEFWAVIAQERVTTCPLTGDSIDPNLLANAKKESLDRKATFMASSAWATFMESAKTVSRDTPELAVLLNGNRHSEVIELIERNAKIVADFCTKYQLSKDSAVWTSPLVNEYMATRRQWQAAVERIPASANQWLNTSCTETGNNALALLRNIASIETKLTNLGEPKVLHTDTFDEATATSLLTIEGLITNEDKLARELHAMPPLDEAMDICTFHSIETAESAILKVQENIESLSVTRSLLTKAEQDLDVYLDGIPLSKDEEILCAYIGLLGDKSFSPFQTLISDIEKKSRDIQNLMVKPMAKWNISLGAEPVSTDIALVRRKSLVEQVDRRTKLETLQSNSNGEWVRLISDKPISEIETNVSDYLTGITDETFNDLDSQIKKIETNSTNLDALNRTKSAPWDTSFGAEPASIEVGQARIPGIDKTIERINNLKGQVQATNDNLTRTNKQIDEITIRARNVENIDSLCKDFSGLRQFLSPKGKAEQILMGQQLLDVIERANDFLAQTGVDVWLQANENFEVLAASSSNPIQQPLSEEGGGCGNLIGIALALALADFHNENSAKTPINCMLIDEPITGINATLVPSIFSALSKSGRQLIIIEHNPSGASYSDRVIDLNVAA